MATTASRRKIDELYQALAEKVNVNPIVFIVSKEGNQFLSDGRAIARELTPDEEVRIRRVKLYVDLEDLNA